MSFYQYHLFICTNERDDGSQNCAACGAKNARNYLKNKCKEIGIHEPGKVRINNAGCLNRCDKGPVIVIYPEETWYTYVDNEDLDEIIEQHLQNGRIVERLLIDR